MSEDKDIIAEKIKSGEYYSEALDWYNSKFTRPKTELVHFSIFTIITVFLFFMVLITLFSVFPLTEKEPFIVSRGLKINETITIKDIDINDKNPNEGVVKFLISQYVKSREEYIEDRINRNFRLVTELSGDEIFEEYLNETDSSNPDNPIFLYGRQAKIEVQISSVALPALPKPNDKKMNPDAEYKAKVNYISDLIFIDDDGESKRMQAEVKFKYKEIDIDQDSHEIKQLPQLIITGYKTKEL